MIEDDYDSEFRFSGRPVPALRGLDRPEAVILAGSFNKVLFPSLRLGYLVLPQSLMDRFLAFRYQADGHEVSGVVERTAPDVTDFRPGDEIYGLGDFPRDGAAAEFAAVRAANLAFKPRSISHAQAAALPLSALTAWQALFEQAHLVSGQSVLIHGGARGVGSEGQSE